MTTTHLILRYAHIAGGMVGLISGAAAMMLGKGSRLHRLAGVAEDPAASAGARTLLRIVTRRTNVRIAGVALLLE